MKAVILCAGYGNRLKPLTNILPKPLFPILGHPLLDNIIFHLKKFGVNEICINTHWLAEKITHHIGDGSKFGVKTNILYEPKILGVGGGIGNMRDFLQDEELFIVHNSDILTNLDIKSAIDFHRKEHSIVTLILHDYKIFNNVTISAGCKILDISNTLKVETDSNPALTKLAFTGVAIMSPEIFNFLSYKKPMSIIDAYIELIKSRAGSLKGYISKTHYWKDIGLLENYLGAHHDILVEQINALSERNVGAYCNTPLSKNIYIGENSTVSPFANLTGFVSIGKNCTIEEGTQLENCVIWDNVIVNKGEIAKNKVLYRI